MQSSLVSELFELLKIDSVIKDEKEIFHYVLDSLSSLTKFQKYTEGLSIYYTTKLDPKKKTIALYGHLDTVPNQQDDKPYIEDGKIFGCGASDMKGGLAIMMELMRKVEVTDDVPYNLVCVFYDQEEGPYKENGLGPILDKYPQLQNCDLAFALEPTDNVLQVGCVGALNVRVTFQGKSAHSARPWHGENAIHKGWKLLEKLSKLEAKEVKYGDLKFFEVTNATVAEGGKARNTIPAHFTLNLNHRFAPGKDLETAQKDLLEWIGDDADVEVVDAAPSGNVIFDNELLQKFIQDQEMKAEAKQAWTDIARLGLYNIPAVNFGPGLTSQAHQKNEYIMQDDLEKCYSLFESFLFSK